MDQVISDLTFNTNGEGFTDLTPKIKYWIAERRIKSGILILSTKHTSCSLVINENADPRVLEDLSRYMKAIVPEEGIGKIFPYENAQPYKHSEEGPDDMPAHIRTALTSSCLSLSIEEKNISLGTWQAIYLWEHRYSVNERTIHLHAIGELT
ncbi:secondary thiamine-phosphate synthase enzyme YjbQ [Prochlorococcus sp. MIT 1341]|uniref:secondary thiamine-phosphate synthase enzyme YjbQ n=1 Tax=Prochlorococcus sp. MIT 1341 TaxID=3096221 RepID=UPI002A74DBD5|nr:secondary thiamine-phosphate synthase enzyme YjbQ [Prochlorococcus sp. MIT 1341]